MDLLTANDRPGPYPASWYDETAQPLPPFPAGLIGLVALVGLRRSPALRRPTALVALLISGALTFVSTVLLFPVATLWGTFMHASGPLLVALTIVAALGGDALLARISQLRHWERPNIVIAPVALIAVAGSLALFQVAAVSQQSRDLEARYAALTASIEAAADEAGERIPATLITDHPMWLAGALDRHAVALPDEPVESIVELSGLFSAPWLVVIDERGRYPAALLDEATADCLESDPVQLTGVPEPAWLFRLASGCEVT